MDDSSTVQIVLNGNGESVALQVASETQWLASESVGGGGSTAPIDISYVDLYDKIVNSELVAGTKYRVITYRSLNFLNGWEIANNNPVPVTPSYSPRQVHLGQKETILVEAISSYELSPIAYSEEYPQDILEYQGYTNTIGVDIGGISNGQTLPDSSVVSGFDLQWDAINEVVYFDMPTGYPALFGHYFYVYAEFSGGTYYQDGCFEPLTPVIAECQYPYTSDDPAFGYPKAMSRLRVSPDGTRVVLVDLAEIDVINYDAGTLYVDTVYFIGQAYGWVTKRTDTQRNISVPFDFRGRKYRRYEVDLTPINPALGLGYWGQGDVYLGQPTTGNYIDVPCFGQDGYDAYDIEWNDTGGADTNWYAGYNDNFVCLEYFYGSEISSYSRNNTLSDCRNNTIGENFIGNTISNGFIQNIIGHSFISNTIGGSFYFNTTKISFQQNNLGNSFQSNNVGNFFDSNRTGDNFQSNNLGNNFSDNTIGNFFINNVIADGFGRNILGNSFQLNFIGHSFQNNTVGNGFNYNETKTAISLNFSLASHVYQNYNCTIFKNSGGVTTLSYVDGTNTVIYTAPNA
jgi:hypothetical protein